jgi:hypothetical protein
VYVATRTRPTKKIAMAAIPARKHVLVEKRFCTRASVLRVTDAAATRDVAYNPPFAYG